MESVYGPKLPVERRVEPVVGCWKDWSLDGDLLVDWPGIGWEGPVITTDPERHTYRRLFAEDKLAKRIAPAVESFKNPGSITLLAFIVGRVDNLGLVVEHDFGWRADRAVIRELWLTPFASSVPERDRRALETRYGCAVRRLGRRRRAYWERIGQYAPSFIGEPIRELHIGLESASGPAASDLPV